MTPAERLQAAIEWIERHKLVRIYRAPETLTDGQKWSLKVWVANHAILKTAARFEHVGASVFVDDALALADAILGGAE